MILATTKVEDFDRFLNTFSTKGVEKTEAAPVQGSTVFRLIPMRVPGLGAVRLGWGGLAELRFRP